MVTRSLGRSLSATIHRWLGLLLALWLALMAVTGGALLFKTSLLQWQYPQLQLAEVPTVEQAAKVFDQQSGSYAYFPDAARPWIEIVSAEGNYRYFDANGRLLLTREHLGDWLDWLVQLHYHLALGDNGDLPMQAFSLLTLVLLLTGLIRWWPRRWSLRHFAIRWSKPGSRLWRATLWQSHRTFGALALPGILLALVTGMGFFFSSTFISGLQVVFSETSEPYIETVSVTRVPQTWQQKLGLAAELLPSAKPRLASLTRGDLRLKLPQEWHPNGRSYLRFPTTHSVQLQNALKQDRGYQIFQTFYPLHIASVGGGALLTLLVVTALALLYLAVSGVWFWWLCRRSRAS
ncbi:PepSY-associated TM helix domain-containing protein [Idiomarina tyrosinivorans]|uniref:PepSY-associated TM helix domain-containing protein n=1 Tax=Idiomarina tyrosinivorans TaxID=1445662 RepID=UPI001300A179|nr:PepSY-associated TM helix domain-containing protein [Idiomarina tyrosinivorans]